MSKIKKKRSIIVAVIKESELIHKIMITIGVVFAVLVNSLLAKFEVAKFYGSSETIDIVLMWIMNIFFALMAFVIICAIKIVCEAIIIIIMPYIVSGIRQLRGIYNHCKIPLTMDEIHEFKSAEDYFTYIMDALCYGDNNNYVKISCKELREIFASCIKVFSSDSLFTMEYGIYSRLSFFIYAESDYDSFKRFFDFFDNYFKFERNHVKIHKQATIESDGSISFIAKTKDKSICLWI